VSYENIRCSIDSKILTVTLNRPERLNAFNTSMLNELLDALEDADTNDNVRAIIFTGSGRGFCAGADLSEGSKAFYKKGSPESHRDGGGKLTLRLYNCKKPIIAAINGPAVGVGVTMTLPMDLRIASTQAKFGLVFARRGIVPEACSSWFLPRIVGISKALEWSYSGRVFGAEEAKDGGLISEIVSPELLLERATEIAWEIAVNTSAVSVALTRQMMWRMLGESHPIEAHRVDSKAIFYLGQSNDAKEGVNAFLNKRSAHFSDSVNTNLPDFFPWWEEPEF
jgi:enoyl-CoA hydratase/carnithine racemase